jgi:hypothetical protein
LAREPERRPVPSAAAAPPAVRFSAAPQVPRLALTDEDDVDLGEPVW